MNNFFLEQTIPWYLLGFLTFFIRFINDISLYITEKKKFKHVIIYIRDFLYTGISIALGISICFMFETSQSACWFISIIMGLFGSTVIDHLLCNKKTIIDKAEDKIDKVIDKKLGINNTNENNNENN